MKEVTDMDNRLQLRQQNKKHAHRGLKIFSIIMGVLILLIIAGVFFFPQLNNTVRNVTGNDTPVDSAVKARLVSGITAQKTGDATTDAAIQRAADTLKATKMSTIMAAAKDQDQAASLLQKASGVNHSQAEMAAAALFQESSVTPIRQAIASGDYYQAYQDAKTLQQQGGTSALTSFLSGQWLRASINLQHNHSKAECCVAGFFNKNAPRMCEKVRGAFM